jgi:hypothetical protein
MLRRAVDNDVHQAEEVVQGPRDVQAGVAHRGDVLSGSAEQPESLPAHDVRAPVGRDIRHAFQ